MALRLADVVVSASDADALRELLDEQSVVSAWRYTLEDDLVGARVVVASEYAESLMDALADRFGSAERFRVILLDVEATLPRSQDDEEGTGDDGEAPSSNADEDESESEPLRISREELYQDVSHSAALTPVYLVTVGLSTVVAAAGLLRGDVAVIIGAMVIAPLLGPNIALSLAATLGDTALARHSAKAIGAGTATVLGLSMAIGLLATVDPSVHELYSKSQVGLGDVAIALASGAAGSLAFTTGLSSAIVGVMVAVALLPPLVATGLFLSSGSPDLAMGAALLVVTNTACLNLTAIATFLAQKVRPRTWWETEKAKRATRLALSSWLILVGVLAGVIFLLR